MTTSFEFSTDTCGVPRDFSQTMEMTLQQTADFFRTYDCFLLCCHANPDGDTLGSALALYHMLDLMGKQVQIVCPTPVPQRLSFLTRETPIEMTLPVDLARYTIVSVDVAAKNLLQSFAPILFDDETDQPRLASPSQKIAGQDSKPTALEDATQNQQDLFHVGIDLAIDHHGTHQAFARRLFLRRDACACGEMIFDLICLLGGYDDNHPMPAVLAVPLYVAISTDSGSFMYENVTAQTHQRVACLLHSGIDHAKICERLYQTKTLSEVRATRAAYDLMHLYYDDKVSMAWFDKQDMEKYMLRDEDISDVVNLLRGIAGVQIAVHIKYRGPGEYKVSVRSESETDIRLLCQIFGGGGHRCAAGCTVYEKDAASVAQRMVEQIGKLFFDGMEHQSVITEERSCTQK